ncbi:MAG TPA: FtsX-like permease family protein [Tissierellaceae bacterium]
MNRNLYSKLARSNIIRNRDTYFPYIFSSVVTVSMFYMLLTIANRTKEADFLGDKVMTDVLTFGVIVIGLFSFLFIFYTNSFLLKRRTKELGLYSVLGMEKRHISRVTAYEILYSSLFSIAIGIVVGIIFSKLMFAVLLNLLKLDTSISLNISLHSIIATIMLFILIFFTVIFFNAIRIHKLNPIDLITGAKKGEREPKSKWLIGILGIISLGSGYYLALTIENPVKAMLMFFIAVILVAIGTYFLFTSGSIIFLKILRRNKRFYYQKNHFISVSNMIYRMKQNAVGLANIAILSTAVLLILSTTVSLYVGLEDILATRYFRDVNATFSFNVDDEKEYEIEEIVFEKKMDNNIKIENIVSYYNLNIHGILVGHEIMMDYTGNVSDDNIYYLKLIPLEDFNRNQDTSFKLNKGQVLLYSNKNYNYNDIVVLGEKYDIKGKLESINFLPRSVFNQIVLIVPDMVEVEKIMTKANELKKMNYMYNINYDYGFDIKGDYEDKVNFVKDLKSQFKTSIEGFELLEDRYTTRQDFISIYGSLFFIGIFLGTLFVIVTVLIIYYKQITEGYDDRERFVILQKVGMSKMEVKKAIKSQILLVFFLPLITAIIHIMFAFPLVRKILALMSLTNTKLFLSTTAIVILVFAIGYGIVYKWTAKAYYKIVN